MTELQKRVDYLDAFASKRGSAASNKPLAICSLPGGEKNAGAVKVAQTLLLTQLTGPSTNATLHGMDAQFKLARRILCFTPQGPCILSSNAQSSTDSTHPSS
jgi:hypothetical protein